MADPTAPHTIWEWMDWVWGFAMGIVGAVLTMLGWVNNRFNGQDAKLAAMNTKMVELDSQVKANLGANQAVDRRLEILDQKTDEQTKILHQLVGQVQSMRGERMREDRIHGQ